MPVKSSIFTCNQTEEVDIKRQTFENRHLKFKKLIAFILGLDCSESNSPTATS